MSVPIVEIIDPTALAKPTYDALYERGLVSDYYQVRRGYHVMRRQGTITSYLMYTVSGRGFFRDRHDHAIRVGPGDFALIEANAYQEYGIWPASKHWDAHWVHFDAQPHWAHWLPLAVPSGLERVSFAHLSSRSLRRQVSDLFFELQMQRTRPEVWRHALSLNLLERILILARGSGSTARPVDPRIWRVLQAIETSGSQLATTGELSAVAGLSPSRLAYLFRQQTGMSLLVAINRVRLRQAQTALHESGSSLADAAERAGFQSPYSFSNWFVKQTGLRPGEYRRKWLERKPAIRPEKPWLRPLSARPSRAATTARPAENRRRP
jgi:AraC family transcriptional regulator, arabinose operon regulatory protein